MLISLNEIKKLVPAAAKIDQNELVKLIGSRLVEVEGAIDLAEKYKDIKIVKVKSAKPIPETHLSVCQIETPAEVQVVCGAPNVRADMLAIWLPEGTVVPETYGTDEPFVLGVRKMRGFESHGMLAGLDEIALGDDHSGIVEIDPNQKNPKTGKPVQAGDFLADVFDLNDTILDIENKSLTHRPDCFGLIGFAREVAGILGVKFDEPELASDLKIENKVTIKIADEDICPRYSCAVINMENATAKDDYLTDTAVFLAKAGMRTISKIVDVTNVLMLMTGQPLHAFDYDKFIKVGGAKEPTIIVRTAKDKEKLTLLDGKEIECAEHDILITSSDIPVALAGAMGGQSTEIDEGTKKVLLESATFSLYNLRKTQMAHGIFSEAITRFTKGQPSAQTLPVLSQAIAQLGGKLESVSDAYPGEKPLEPIELTLDDINSLLGTNYDIETVIKTLDNVGIKTEEELLNDFSGGVEGDKAMAGTFRNMSGTRAREDFSTETSTETSRAQSRLEKSTSARRELAVSENVFHRFAVTPPSWRTDLHIKEDIIEEVGRLLGYDNIAKTYPLRPFLGAKRSDLLNLKTKIRGILSDRLFGHELLTYSFVHKNLQEKFGEDPADSYEIVNSISPDLQVFRQSLLPSLLDKAAQNLKQGYKGFTLYEMNQISKKSLGLTDERVPVMETHLAVLTTGDYYRAKALAEALLKELKLDFNIEIQQTKTSVLRKFKIDQPISGFELDLNALLQAPKSAAKVKTFSKFPAVERDLTVKTEQPYGVIETAIRSALSNTENLTFSLTPTSVYQPKNDSAVNFSFHLKFASVEKTLENSEISAIMENIEQAVKKQGGQII